PRGVREVQLVLGPDTLDRPVQARRAHAGRGRRDSRMNLRRMLARATAMDTDELRAHARTAFRIRAERLRFEIARPRWSRARLAGLLDPSTAPSIADACRAASRGNDLDAH